MVDSEGETVGACGLIVSDREAELGYWIGAPFRGAGHAAAAARAAVRFAFGEAGLDRVVALPLAENSASRRVLENAGLRLVGLQPAEARWAGQTQALYEVTRDEGTP